MAASSHDIARRALRLITGRGLEPTPANYSRLYDEIARGVDCDAPAPAHDPVQEQFLKVMRMMVDNIGALVADDQGLQSQMEVVRQAIASPLEGEAIEQAERALDDVMFRRNLLKQGLIEAKAALKQMVASFIEQLGRLSESTGDYHDTMENLAQQVRQTEDMSRLKGLIDELMSETRNVQASTLRAREEALVARRQVEIAESRIVELEADLAESGTSDERLPATPSRYRPDEALRHGRAGRYRTIRI